MRTEKYPAQAVRDLIRERIVVSLADISEALGNPAHRTVCRKLAEAGCRSSYSHRGSHYTLDQLAAYDENGLWSWNGIHFSAAGTLMSTAAALVPAAAAGQFADELEAVVKVPARDTLRKLVVAGLLSRERVDGRFLYCSADPAVRARQVRTRQTMMSGVPPQGAGKDSAEVRQAAGVLFGIFDERQRRLYAGFESLRHGHGGDRLVADWLGMNPSTVAKGRKQLLSGEFETGRVRRAGGGRKPIEKKTPRSSN